MIDWRAIARDVAPVAARVGITAPLFASVKGLSTAENWLINICRALIRKARLIVMDEPTASLSATESEKLFAIIADLSRSGVAVLYVSHRLDEVLRLCRRVTAFRDGRSVAQIERPQLTRGRIGEAIVGGSRRAISRQRTTRCVAERGGAAAWRTSPGCRGCKGVSFALRRGEVLGIGGLVGAGRTELARLIYGADRVDAGRMTLAGEPFAPRSPAAAVSAGLGLVPEERRSEGLRAEQERGLQPATGQPRAHPAPGPLIDGRRREALVARRCATWRSRRRASRRRSAGSAAATSRRW